MHIFRTSCISPVCINILAPIWGFRFFHICLVDSAGQQTSVAFMLRGISQPVIPIETLRLFLGSTFGGNLQERIQHPPKTTNCRVYSLKPRHVDVLCNYQKANLYITYSRTLVSPSCELLEKPCRTSSEQLRKITRCCMMFWHATSTSASSHHNLFSNCLQET